jgi:glycosyltransferase involved in cell wall biosynthesis
MELMSGQPEKHGGMVGNGKKRVSFFLPNLQVGGAERCTVYLANGLAQRGYRVDMVLMKADGPNLQGVAEPVRIVDLNTHRAMASIRSLARYLRREKPDVLLPALEHANVAAFFARALARVPVPLVANVHTTVSRALGHGVNFQHRTLALAVRWCYPRMDAIATVSRGAAEDLIRVAGASPQRVRVIYPILTDGIGEIARGPVGHPWFADGQPRAVLGVGRLCPQKDFATLIRAFALVRRRHAVRLVIFGQGDLREELERLVKELDLTEVAVLAGYAENIFSCMAKAALFTLSSAWEAMPMVLTEALACGCPVVATDCRSGPDEILQGGRYGRLAPVGDVEGLAEAMCRTLSEPRPEFPREALRPFSADFVLDQYSQMIEEVSHA